MKRSALAAVATFALLCGLWTPIASGQAVFGSILGTATDPSGAAVPNAKVTVTSQTKDTVYETTTNESGNYSVTHLIPDVYSVRFEAQGFKSLEFKDITVSADTGTDVNGQFQVGSTSEQVEVTSEAPQLKTDREDVAIEFNARAIEDAPILNRNFTCIRTSLARHAETRRLEPCRNGESARRPADLRQRPALQRNGLRTRRHRQPGSDSRDYRCESEPGRDSGSQGRAGQLRRRVRQSDRRSSHGSDQVRQQ